ncbi:MAG: copper homeostasis protein CutC [Bacteroidia bacterium]|nr:copper homeostasis protein CutC [Bacteroidia bacterium]
MVREVCVESFQEAVLAEAAGASRIELCDNLSYGGTTPSYGTIRKTIDKLHIPVMVMIRPRGGDFVYTKDEFEIMRNDIQICRELGVTGVVFGMLNLDDTIDIERTSELVNIAHPLLITFHKAIDLTDDILLSVNQLKTIGIDRILSSGGRETAIEGFKTLRKMIEIAGDRIKIIVAGKVTWGNFDEVTRLIPGGEYHGRRLVKY